MYKIIIGIIITLGPNLWAQDTEYRPAVVAHQITTDPIIDGEVLRDEVWNQITPINQLWQSKPDAGKPATEKTEFRIAYSSTTLYISAVCFDTEPEKIVAADSRRDASLDDMDAVLFILDTYHDKQNGFVFGTNVLGLEYDAQVSNEGTGGIGGNRQQRGNISGFNLNWDASWQVKTKVGDFGWSAEFAIPLRTLRFKSGEQQTWGINFRRNIQKNNEIDYWAALPIQFNLNRLSLAGNLQGLNLKSPGNLKFIPYALGKAVRDGDPPKTTPDYDLGADIKYSITSGMTLDLTYNTDFAQVEVDEQQINLDRFNLFFPEKRPFFLENAGLFSVGSPGEVDLFFSRRIGIGVDGSVVPIIGGARLSGKMNATNIGILSMVTDQTQDKSVQKNNFSVARINHEFKSRSSIGALFVNRQGLEDNEQDDYNRTFALDGKWGLGQKAQISGFLAKTQSPNSTLDDHAFKLQTRYDWDGWILNAAYTEVANDFNPEVGFLRRKAFRKPEFLIFKRIRPKDFYGFLELRPHISYRSFWDFTGFKESSFLHIDNHWVWQSRLEIHTGINFTTEGVKDNFSINGVNVSPGTYNHAEAQIVFRTNASKPVSVSTFHRLGGFYGGRRYANRVALNIRLGDKFNTSYSLNNNIIHLPEGSFNTNLFSSRWSYSFSPRLFTQALIQYNSVSEKWVSNIRFGWLQDANSGLFVVLNTANNSFLIKYSRLFDLIR